MKTPPNIIAARITGPFTINMEWSTGETFTADLKELAAPPFDPLCNAVDGIARSCLLSLKIFGSTHFPH